jgi:hypothetical protein
VKAFVNKYGRQPRSTRKGTGLITSVFQISEYVWEHAAHPYVDASACVWPKNLVRNRAKLHWSNLDDDDDVDWNQSSLEYSFRTLVSLDRLLDTEKLLLSCSSTLGVAQCAFPCGCANKLSVPNWLTDDSEPDELPIAVQPGEPCFILGFRYASPLLRMADWP